MPTVKLSEIAHILPGKLITKRDLKPGDIPVISGRGGFGFHNCHTHDGELITVAGCSGKIERHEGKIWCNKAFVIVPKNPQEIPPITLYYILLSYQKEIQSWTKAYAIIPHIRKNKLENLKIHIPNLSTLKQHIAEIKNMKEYALLLEAQARNYRLSFMLKIAHLKKAP